MKNHFFIQIIAWVLLASPAHEQTHLIEVLRPSFSLLLFYLAAVCRWSEPNCLLRETENIIIHNAWCGMYANKGTVRLFEAGVMSWLCFVSPWIHATTFPGKIRGKDFKPSLSLNCVWTVWDDYEGSFVVLHSWIAMPCRSPTETSHLQHHPVQNVVGLCIVRFKNVSVKEPAAENAVTSIYVDTNFQNKVYFSFTPKRLMSSCIMVCDTRVNCKWVSKIKKRKLLKI